MFKTFSNIFTKRVAGLFTSIVELMNLGKYWTNHTYIIIVIYYQSKFYNIMFSVYFFPKTAQVYIEIVLTILRTFDFILNTLYQFNIIKYNIIKDTNFVIKLPCKIINLFTRVHVKVLITNTYEIRLFNKSSGLLTILN